MDTGRGGTHLLTLTLTLTHLPPATTCHHLPPATTYHHLSPATTCHQFSLIKREPLQDDTAHRVDDDPHTQLVRL